MMFQGIHHAVMCGSVSRGDDSYTNCFVGIINPLRVVAFDILYCRNFLQERHEGAVFQWTGAIGYFVVAKQIYSAFCILLLSLVID